ncbi:hypothetical protein [Bradyrhizobium sp. WSM471]|uniref:hypothetical protein n=1 Tax=Bradyrhizobium sp. WSM471 TaxID=319017 RepID=UPI00024D212A|nr:MULTISPECIES: hypothetical protein [Bradyrhizobium]EHR01300.1 hypothetical protein Bra471DRAFT_02006 [Bradyrhizobium sp. WSM471]UFW43362.1 hypothetical protein BcanWSM471_09875 [Bradyrhizobium canariense]
MLVHWNAGPRRYFVNADGHRVLIGLSRAETAEFEMLDDPPSRAEEGSAIGGSGSTCVNVDRWSELYTKHEDAWRIWIARSRTEAVSSLALF